MADQYLDYPIVADAQDLMQRSFDYMANAFPGWSPSEGQLDTMILEAVGSQAADIATMTTEVPKSIFRYFGAQLCGVIPIDDASATCTSTWTMMDNKGYIIPDGTQVTMLDPSGNPVPFVTVGDVQVPAGSTVTTTGQVILQAVVPGADSSGIGAVGAPVVLLDILPFVSSITQTTVTTGGTDAETDDDYLTRLSQALQLAANRPILPRDFALLARNADPIIQRACCIDGYNTADSTYNNQRMVTMAAVDINGNDVGTTVLGEIKTYLDSLREINFVVNTIATTYTNVDVTCDVLLDQNYSLNDVQYRVQLAIQAFLNPQNWGIESSDNPNLPVTWDQNPTVSYNEVVSAISAVPGVVKTISATIGLAGGAQTAADHTLAGVASLPRPGNIIVNVSLS